MVCLINSLFVQFAAAGVRKWSRRFSVWMVAAGIIWPRPAGIGLGETPKLRICYCEHSLQVQPTDWKLRCASSGSSKCLLCICLLQTLHQRKVPVSELQQMKQYLIVPFFRPAAPKSLDRAGEHHCVHISALNQYPHIHTNVVCQLNRNPRTTLYCDRWGWPGRNTPQKTRTGYVL